MNNLLLGNQRLDFYMWLQPQLLQSWVYHHAKHLEKVLRVCFYAQTVKCLTHPWFILLWSRLYCVCTCVYVYMCIIMFSTVTFSTDPDESYAILDTSEATNSYDHSLTDEEPPSGPRRRGLSMGRGADDTVSLMGVAGELRSRSPSAVAHTSVDDSVVSQQARDRITLHRSATFINFIHAHVLYSLSSFSSLHIHDTVRSFSSDFYIHPSFHI